MHLFFISTPVYIVYISYIVFTVQSIEKHEANSTPMIRWNTDVFNESDN